MLDCIQNAGRRRRIAGFGSAMLVASCGVTTDQCAKADNHFSIVPPEDLGNGLVLNARGGAHGNSRTYVKSAFRSVIDCETGAEVTFVLLDVSEIYGAGDGQSTITSFASSDLPIDAGEAGDDFETYLDAGDFETLAEVRARAEDLGIVMRQTTSEREDCGCAVFYPEMLGNKEPAQERNA